MLTYLKNILRRVFSKPPTTPQFEVPTLSVEEPLEPVPTPTLLIEEPVAPVEVVKEVKKRKTSSKKKKK